MMASTLLIVPLVAILGVAMLGLPGEIAALAAVTCFMGGLIRILYALFLESNAAAAPPVAQQQYVPPSVPPNYLGTFERGASLPPARTPPAAADYRAPRYNTGELVGPPRASVTDHTTRLLHKEPDEQGERQQ
jgi:hypothetical protein